MYKKALSLFLILFFACMLTSCKSKLKAIILFNQAPITKDNFLSNSSQFVSGKRIYYIFITEKPLGTDIVRVRVFKREDKANMEISKVVYSNDFRLRKGEQYYYTDYLVFNEAGYYCMKVYSLASLDRPLAVSDFQITN